MNGTAASLPDDGSNKTFGSRGFILADGTLITTSTSYNSTCSSSPIVACGWIVIDVNGFNGPNTVGKDIFCFWVRENQLIPAGAPGTYAAGTGYNECTTGGWGCAYSYLTGAK